MRKQIQALGRLKIGQMNKTESAYCQHLEPCYHERLVYLYRYRDVQQ